MVLPFQPGMIVETLFLFPDRELKRPVITHCVVMAVHLKGIMVHPIVKRGSCGSDFVTFTMAGRVICDVRNIIESPTHYVVAQKTMNGKLRYSCTQLDERDFAAVKAKALDCISRGVTRSERLRAPAQYVRTLRNRADLRVLQQPSVTERGRSWAPLPPRSSPSKQS